MIEQHILIIKKKSIFCHRYIHSLSNWKTSIYTLHFIAKRHASLLLSRWKHWAVMAARLLCPGWTASACMNICPTFFLVATAHWSVSRTCGSWRLSMWEAFSYIYSLFQCQWRRTKMFSVLWRWTVSLWIISLITIMSPLIEYVWGWYKL